jgi:hypothetical protein
VGVSFTFYKKDAEVKLIFRYAFLHYLNTKEAADVVKNDTKYKVNNQILSVSYFDNTKSSWTNEKLSSAHRSSRQSQPSRRTYR